MSRLCADRWTLLFLSLVLTILAAWGCGSGDQAYYEELARYTPENLANELLSRYQVQASGERARELEANAADNPKAQAEIAAKSASKAALGGVEGLVEDIAAKAKTIKGIPPQEVFAQIAQRIDESSKLPEKDKAELKERLKQAMGIS